jgi:hypothetical protein
MIFGRTINNVGVAIVALLALFIAFGLGCETDGSSGTTSDEEDLTELPELCNSLYTNFLTCSSDCNRGGLCLEECVTVWFEKFLDCAEDFSSELGCYDGCFDDAGNCFETAGPEDHDLRQDCYDQFTECLLVCPPVMAEESESE